MLYTVSFLDPSLKGKKKSLKNISIYNSSNLCVCVCLRPPFLDNHRSDLIETCQEYCRGPEDVPFSRFDINWTSASQVTAIYLSTNDMTRCYDATNDVTMRPVFFSDIMSQLTLGPEYVPFQSLILFFFIRFSCFPSVSQGLKAVFSKGLN